MIKLKLLKSEMVKNFRFMFVYGKEIFCVALWINNVTGELIFKIIIYIYIYIVKLSKEIY